MCNTKILKADRNIAALDLERIALLARAQEVAQQAKPPTPQVPNSQKPKTKRKNTEKRKQYSKLAARARRSTEAEIFDELTELIPSSIGSFQEPNKSSNTKMDTARLALGFLKCQTLAQKSKANSNRNDFLDLINASELQSALAGFMLAFTSEHDIVYASPEISEYLGLEPIDLIATSLLDILHPCDHQELSQLFSDHSASGTSTLTCLLTLRFKCLLNGRARCMNIRSAGYRPVHLSGKLVTSINDQACFVCNAYVPQLSKDEVQIPSRSMISFHSLDMKFSVESAINDDQSAIASLLGYTSSELAGASFYDLIHPQDVRDVVVGFTTLLGKGHCVTRNYRLLTKYGDFVWIKSEGSLIKNFSTDRNKFLNRKITSKDQNDMILMIHNPIDFDLKTTTDDSLPESKTKNQEVIEDYCQPMPPSPKPITESILRSLSVSNSFIDSESNQMPASPYYDHIHEDLGITAEDELVHLAPCIGDTNVPLELPEMLDLENIWDEVDFIVSADNNSVGEKPVQIANSTKVEIEQQSQPSESYITDKFSLPSFVHDNDLSEPHSIPHNPLPHHTNLHTCHSKVSDKTGRIQYEAYTTLPQITYMDPTKCSNTVGVDSDLKLAHPPVHLEPDRKNDNEMQIERIVSYLKGPSWPNESSSDLKRNASSFLCMSDENHHSSGLPPGKRLCLHHCTIEGSGRRKIDAKGASHLNDSQRKQSALITID